MCAGDPTGEALGEALGEARRLVNGGLESKEFAATSPAGSAVRGGGIADLARGGGGASPGLLLDFTSNVLLKSSTAFVKGFRGDTGDRGPVLGRVRSFEPRRWLLSESSEET